MNRAGSGAPGNGSGTLYHPRRGHRHHGTDRFPTDAPDLNPAEGVWAHLKHSLGNLAACTTVELAALARTPLKRMQNRPALLDGFIAETGLIPAPP